MAVRLKIPEIFTKRLPKQIMQNPRLLGGENKNEPRGIRTSEQQRNKAFYKEKNGPGKNLKAQDIFSKKNALVLDANL